MLSTTTCLLAYDKNGPVLYFEILSELGIFGESTDKKGDVSAYTHLLLRHSLKK